jgi:tRNA threonylcarbamoyladenosine biosynthesis protein TsaE
MNNFLKTRYDSRSAADTEQVAADFAASAKPGDIYCLTGELAAGKTVFAKGFAKGLGCAGDVTSPTFTLMCVHDGGRLILYHFDLYRLEGGMEALESIGFEDYLYAGGVCLVEWADKIPEALPEPALWVDIIKNQNKGNDYREIVVWRK